MAFPVTINGNTYTEAMFEGYGYQTAFPDIVGDVATVADDLVDGSVFTGTSTTSLTIGTGSKTFTIAETNRGWAVGAQVRAAKSTDTTQYMVGIITAYTGNSLTVNVSSTGGSGTHATWSIGFEGATAGVSGSWTVKTTTYTAAASDKIFADTSGGAWTLTLPASATLGDTIEVVDYAGTFATNNLTVGRNGLVLMGLTEDMTVSTSNAAFRLIYSGATYGWRLA